ncbi:MAG: glycosyltransferase family 2 protein [Patescibacteria group bacterium]
MMKKRVSISLCMIVLNEEKFLKRSLANVAPYVDEIIIVDGGSTDGTLKIAERFKARIIQAPWKDDFAAQRNIGLRQAKMNWILVIDADEVYEKKLLEELQPLAENNIGIDAFAFPRKNYIDGKQTSAYPDRQTRFFKRDKKIHYEKPLHEQVVGFRRIASPMDLHIIHRKTSQRQALQNGYYEVIERSVKNVDLEETIFFYTRNDYLIVNNLLCGNMDRLWRVAEIVNNDSRGVLKEYKAGERALDTKSIERFQNRIYQKLNDEAKKKILKIARDDVSNILSAMKPTNNKMVLYRNVRVDDVLPNCNLNDTVEFKIISSTSAVPSDPNYNFYRYEITIPKNGFVLELDQFDSFVRNEDCEILLPPMKCKVTNTRNSNNENCKGIIELEYLEKISVNI